VAAGPATKGDGGGGRGGVRSCSFDDRRDFELRVRRGPEVLIDLARAAAHASGSCANFVLNRVDDHVVRMSVMTEPFYRHRHPDSDETFLVLEGKVLLQTANDRVELGPGQLYTVPAGLAHITSAIIPRSVNITVEKTGMSTERIIAPARAPKTSGQRPDDSRRARSGHPAERYRLIGYAVLTTHDPRPTRGFRNHESGVVSPAE
jgi:quercetin dioxygenase-like cupin family protein